jgi:hypothetical protein
MDYLVDCKCTHDLTQHDDLGCHGDHRRCRCPRTKLQALDAAIDIARTNPWSHSFVEGAGEGDPGEAASA